MDKKMRFAHPLHRFLAWGIDWVISVLFLTGGLWIVSQTTMPVELIPNLISALVVMLLGSSVFTLVVTPLLISRFGGGVGKIVSGLAITDAKGNYLSFWYAFFRSTVGYMIASSLLGLGFIWAFFNKEHQGWHDMVLNDVVVVRQTAGILIGLVVLVGVILLNGWVVGEAISGLGKNENMYGKIYTQLEKENTANFVKKAPEATPAAQPAALPY